MKLLIFFIYKLYFLSIKDQTPLLLQLFFRSFNVQLSFSIYNFFNFLFSLLILFFYESGLDDCFRRFKKMIQKHNYFLVKFRLINFCYHNIFHISFIYKYINMFF